MKLVPRLAWAAATTPPSPLPERLVPLLEAIGRTGSLLHAVTQCGISYRTGWGVVHDAQHLLGVPLVELARGRRHGATLAPAGRRLVEAAAAAGHRIARLSPRLAIDLGGGPVRRTRASVERVRIAASHDLALAALRDELASQGVALDLRFVGSLLALEEFAQGRARAAGFHVLTGAGAGAAHAPFLRHLAARRDRLVRVVEREQGLILPRGNPARVRSLRDVALRGLRFVNRQRGSGTRLLIDRRLASEGIAAETLQGYANEEYTHAAVAATVASGGADAGFGLRAAASEYGLAFVPLARERYYLAVRAADLGTDALAPLVDALRGPAFARIVAGLPGYRATRAGTVTSVDSLARGASR